MNKDQFKMPKIVGQVEPGVLLDIHNSVPKAEYHVYWYPGHERIGVEKTLFQPFERIHDIFLPKMPRSERSQPIRYAIDTRDLPGSTKKANNWRVDAATKALAVANNHDQFLVVNSLSNDRSAKAKRERLDPRSLPELADDQLEEYGLMAYTPPNFAILALGQQWRRSPGSMGGLGRRRVVIQASPSSAVPKR